MNGQSGYNQSIYTEPISVRTVPNEAGPEWKSPPAPAAPAVTNTGLSPRAKAGIAVGGLVLAATGAFAWSNYAAAQAKADVQKAQIALEMQKLDLQRTQQTAEMAKTAGQETEAQRARREAVSGCVAKAGGAFNAVEDCGRAFPLVDSPGMAVASQTVAGEDGPPVNGAGLVVIGGVGVVGAGVWVKRRYARS